MNKKNKKIKKREPSNLITMCHFCFHFLKNLKTFLMECLSGGAKNSAAFCSVAAFPEWKG
jgi:hypothetical protein